MIADENPSWNPITFGLDNILNQSNAMHSDNYSDYQSTNLINIANSYLEAGLYYDAITYIAIDYIAVAYNA